MEIKEVDPTTVERMDVEKPDVILTPSSETVPGDEAETKSLSEINPANVLPDILQDQVPWMQPTVNDEQDKEMDEPPLNLKSEFVLHQNLSDF